MAIDRNILVRAASKIVGKESAYRVHNYFLNKRFANISYSISREAKEKSEVLQALSSDGIFRTHLQKLSFTDSEISNLSDEYHKWADGLEGFNVGQKFYEHKMNPDRLTALDESSWLYRIASDERLVNIAQEYFGNQGCSLFYADYWYTVPTTGERVASQLWHRDPEDSRLLKVFIYLDDVTEDNGYIEFVKKTSNGLEYGNLEPRHKVSQSVKASQAADKFVSENEQMRFKGLAKKYDVVFCDTTGFHRGGFVQKGSRKLINFIYVSKNCPHIFYSVLNKNGEPSKINF